MSKYQIDAETIRQKAHKISLKGHDGCCGEIRRDILSLIEEAAGEKLEELFDEGNVRHGAVFLNRCDVMAIIIEDFLTKGAFSAHVIHPNDDNLRTYDGRNYQRGASDVIQFLRQGTYKYLGQYDFSAGLPK
jgi:hypothetical protein